MVNQDVQFLEIRRRSGIDSF